MYLRAQHKILRIELFQGVHWRLWQGKIKHLNVCVLRHERIWRKKAIKTKPQATHALVAILWTYSYTKIYKTGESSRHSFLKVFIVSIFFTLIARHCKCVFYIVDVFLITQKKTLSISISFFFSDKCLQLRIACA